MAGIYALLCAVYFFVGHDHLIEVAYDLLTRRFDASACRAR